MKEIRWRKYDGGIKMEETRWRKQDGWRKQNGENKMEETNGERNKMEESKQRKQIYTNYEGYIPAGWFLRLITPGVNEEENHKE